MKAEIWILFISKSQKNEFYLGNVIKSKKVKKKNKNIGIK